MGYYPNGNVSPDIGLNPGQSDGRRLTIRPGETFQVTISYYYLEEFYRNDSSAAVQRTKCHGYSKMIPQIVLRTIISEWLLSSCRTANLDIVITVRLFD